MKPLTIAVGCLALSIIIKLGIFFFANSVELEHIPRFGFLLVILIGIFLGIRQKHKTTGGDFGDYVKEGMKVAALYSILLSAFTYINYSWIDQDYLASKIEQRLNGIEERVDAKGLSPKPEDIENERKGAEMIFSPFTHSTVTLISFLFLGVFYSLVIAWLVRNSPLKYI